MTFGLFNLEAPIPPEDNQLYYPADNYPGYTGQFVAPPGQDGDVPLGYRGRIHVQRHNPGDPTWVEGPFDPPIPWLNLSANMTACGVDQTADGSGRPQLTMVPVGDPTWDIPDNAVGLQLVVQLEYAADVAPDGSPAVYDFDDTQKGPNGSWQPRDLGASPVVPNNPLLGPWTSGGSPWGGTTGNINFPVSSPYVTMLSHHNTYAPPANGTPKAQQNLWPGGILVIPAMRAPAVTDAGEDYRSSTQFWPKDFIYASPPLAVVAITSVVLRYSIFGGGGGGSSGGSSGSGSGGGVVDLNWSDLEGINLSGLPPFDITGKLLSTGIRFG